MAGFTGVKRERAISPDVDRSSAARIADMDFEGADVNFMLPSGWFGTFTTGDDVALEMAHVSRLPSLDGGLLRCRIPSGSAAWCWPARAMSRAASRRCAAPGASVGVGRAGLCAVRHADRPAVARSDLGRGAGARSVGGAAHLHGDAALCAGRAGHLGQSLAATFGGASVVRHAQHGGADRQRTARPFPDAASGLPGGRPWLAAVLDGAAGRAHGDDPLRAAARPEAPSQRIRHGRPLLSRASRCPKARRSPTWWPISSAITC